MDNDYEMQCAIAAERKKQASNGIQAVIAI